MMTRMCDESGKGPIKSMFNTWNGLYAEVTYLCTRIGTRVAFIFWQHVHCCINKWVRWIMCSQSMGKLKSFSTVRLTLPWPTNLLWHMLSASRCASVISDKTLRAPQNGPGKLSGSVPVLAGWTLMTRSERLAQRRDIASATVFSDPRTYAICNPALAETWTISLPSSLEMISCTSDFYDLYGS